ncbi:MAG: pyruvate kinase, partial [Acidiferrobacterales bacterium]
NAVLDGSDAVMLSAETAAGKFPVAAVSAMDRVCRVAEQEQETALFRDRRGISFQRVDEAIAMAVMYSANHMTVKAIAALTESGSTALWMSRITSSVPIYAMTRHEATRRKVTLYRGVYPATLEYTSEDPAQIMLEAAKELRRLDVVREGDLVILTMGEPLQKPGGTNSMKILRVDSHLTVD